MSGFDAYLRGDLGIIDRSIDDSLENLATRADGMAISMSGNIPFLHNQLAMDVELMKGKTEMEYFSTWNSFAVCNMAEVALRCPDPDIKRYHINIIEKYRAWWKREARTNMDEVLRRYRAKYDEALGF